MSFIIILFCKCSGPGFASTLIFAWKKENLYDVDKVLVKINLELLVSSVLSTSCMLVFSSLDFCYVSLGIVLIMSHCLWFLCLYESLRWWMDHVIPNRLNGNGNEILILLCIKISFPLTRFYTHDCNRHLSLASMPKS